MLINKKTEIVQNQPEVKKVIKSVKEVQTRGKRLFFRYLDNFGEILVVLALFFLIDKGVDFLYTIGVVDQTSPNQYISIQDIEKWLLSLLIAIQFYNIFNLVLQVKYDFIDDLLENKDYIKLFNSLSAWQKFVVYLWLLSIAAFVFTQVLQGIA